MQRKWLQACAALCLAAACLGQVEAGVEGLVVRQDASPTEDNNTIRPTPTGGDEEQRTTTAGEGSEATEVSSIPEVSPTGDDSTSQTSEPSPTAVPSAINGNTPDNSTETVRVAPGDLPLEPRLTPGWGVAGAIMLVTGVTYTLVGIKNSWLHTFFSSGFLTSLCTAILIVYVMSPPIRDAVQGGFVVAVVITGLVLGGGSTLFRELTEGFGCLLGGFCVSMWLLTLKEGGLLTGTTEKIIFISAFTLGGYVFYFSHHTRILAQIVLMSFSGATVTVLGIDCFTRAGLKEYWAYIWHLNKDLFPLNISTYPQTKVIRVETALIIIFTTIGVISQLKLWKVVQERRAKRAEEQAELERQRELEEAQVGQQVEEENERERRQWEATYGDKPPGTTIGSGESRNSSNIEDEKKARYSQSTVQVPAEHDIEMEDMTSSNTASSSRPSREKTNGLVVANQHGDDARITVRVARDDDGPPPEDESTPPMPEPEEKVWIAGADGEVRPASPASAHRSVRTSKSAGPEVVPLPFKIPPHVEEAEEKDDDDRSSVATFADDDARSVAMSKRNSHGTMGNRLSMLSTGSGKILRSLSGRSQRSQASKRRTQDFAELQKTRTFGESQEELVVGRRDSKASSASVAATIDGLSEADTDRSGGEEADEPRRSIEITAELTDGATKDETGPEGPKTGEEEPKPEPSNATDAEGVGAEKADPSAEDEATEVKSKRASTDEPAKADAITVTVEDTEPNAADQADSPKKPRSTATSASSRMSLTKDRLPSGLSRVALSYRTNEWAKHLSQAETPEPETLMLNEYPNEEVVVTKKRDGEKKTESAVPVNIDELQQTAENTVPQPPAPVSSPLPAATPARPYSSVSGSAPVNTNRPISRAASTSPPTQADTGAPASPTSPLPPNALQATHSFRMKSGGTQNRRTSTDIIASPIAEEHTPDVVVSAPARPEDGGAEVTPSPPPLEQPQQLQQQQTAIRNSVAGVIPYASPHTLLGQREMLLRNKSQSMLLGASSPIPEYPEYSEQPNSGSGTPSDAGSLYNYRSSSTPMPMPMPTPTQQPTVTADIDDIPLSQRKEMMRQSSLVSLGGAGNGNRNSVMTLQNNGGQVPRSTPTPTPHLGNDASVLHFNSHQPQRRSVAATPAQREAQLANFRSSVAADLRSGFPGDGRETPLLAASANNLLQQQKLAKDQQREQEDVQASIERSRNAMLSRRDQEARKRELELREKERGERAIEDMMRTPAGAAGLADAHREAMRRLQGGVKNM